jgi:glycosyltransferase involved in cell wall biosynthesis
MKNIAHFVSDVDGGGNAVIARYILQHLDRSRFAVSAVSCGPGGVAAELAAEADRHFDLGTGSAPFGLYAGSRGAVHKARTCGRLAAWTARTVAGLAGLIRREGFDLVHTHSLHYHLVSGLACRIAGAKSVWHIHEPVGGRRHLAGGKWVRFGVESLLSAALADRFVAVSGYVRSTFPGQWQAKSALIPNATDIGRIEAFRQSGRIRSLLGAGPDAPVVGAVGIVTERKGFDWFVRIAAEVCARRDDVRFVLIGGPPNELGRAAMQGLVDLAGRLGLGQRLRFLGEMRDVSLAMGDLDLFVMCSRPGTEAFGLVAVEALANGVPVIAFDNDAMSEIVQEAETGHLVPDGDIGAAAGRICRLLADRRELSRMKEAARLAAGERFGLAGFTARIEDLYHTMLSGPAQDDPSGKRAQWAS